MNMHGTCAESGRRHRGEESGLVVVGSVLEGVFPSGPL